MRLSWVQPEDLVPHELVQSDAELKDTAALRQEWLDAGGEVDLPRGGATPVPASAQTRAHAREILDRLDAQAAPQPDPTTWQEVLQLLPQAVHLPGPDPDTIADRVHGAWLGRSAGCLLGKPVEKIPREGIETILRSAGRWPLDAYFTADGVPDEVTAAWPWNKNSRSNSLAENIDGMPEDDDLNYPILNLVMLEHHGRGFTTDDVAQSWLLSLPAGRVFTAERIAYRNLLDGVEPALCARVHNPFREWIGALIRTDVYGWINPGDPREAARMAWVDARLSHTRNGVWGAMWAAALTSASLVASSIDEVLDAGLSVVPQDSALASAVRRGAQIGRAGGAIEADLDTLHAEYGHLHWVHSLNNAAVVAYALSKSGGDFDTAAPLAVMPGWDTDSAAATVGSVAGGLAGRTGLAPRWTAPLDNCISTSLPGMDQIAIDDLARRTCALIRTGNHASPERTPHV